MKKMNNKGFAISSLLYGLLVVGFLTITLLMSSLSINRKNTKILIEQIEEELGRYGKTKAEFSSSTQPQQFIVPYSKAGFYKIELWHSGKYASAILELSENQHLNFYVNNSSTKSNVYAVRLDVPSSKPLLSTDETEDDITSFTGSDQGVISGTINISNKLQIQTADSAVKAKIELMNERPSANLDLYDTSGKTYRYYIIDSNEKMLTINSNLSSVSMNKKSELSKQKIAISKDNSYYKIINQENEYELYDNNGTIRFAAKDSYGDKQNWQISYIYEIAAYQIKNKGTGKCLEVNGSTLKSDSCDTSGGTSAQLFQIRNSDY